MEEFVLKNDINVMGFQVKTFPNGIEQAFENLVNTVEGGSNRNYYGIGFMTADGKIIYQAAAELKDENELSKYRLEKYVIQRGRYLAVTLRNWRKNLQAIKPIFEKITADERVRHSPCIEWYKNDDEMICMVKISD